jgi:teichuronic acid biosynthesis glycosyltransferase TuaC
MARPVRTLLFSTLYPSSARPGHGIFVETRLRELLASGEVQTKVVAPVPWFPLTGERWGEYGRMASTPGRETRHGIDVLHPRFPHLPKVGMTIAPFLLAAAALGPIRKLMREGFDFDLIDAHYFYPDGVAAALLSRRLARPFCITARGSDVNLIARYALPRRLMQWAARGAAACIGVSAALVAEMRRVGLDFGRLLVLRNGVDLARFAPVDRDAARRELGLAGSPLLLSVGNLVPLKGHDLCIGALKSLRATWPQAALVIVGAGPERARLEALAAAEGLTGAVRFAGSVANTELARWYGAADLLLLASSREGWPNVLLEAMACGTPVVATAVGGIPEIVRDGRVGSLVTERSAEALAEAASRLLADGVDRAAIRRWAEGFGWEETTRGQLALFGRMSAATGAAHA